MATIRPMRPNDLLLISSTNLDHLTETYNISFYMEYLTKWPELCQVIEGIDGDIEGYSMCPIHIQDQVGGNGCANTIQQS
jgi:N-terminal acetyltransferase B complex catalytic subunit